MKNKSLLILLFLMLIFGGLQAQIDTVFWFAAPDREINHHQTPIQFCFTTYEAAATITVEQPTNSAFPTTSFTVPAGSFYVLDVSNWVEDIESKPANTVLNRGFHISSTEFISCYYECVGNNSEMYTLKGSSGLGTDFLVPMQVAFNSNYSSSTSSIEIIATEDNTVVQITAPVALQGGITAGSTVTVTLQRGQSYVVRAASTDASAHLHNTIIHSSKPIAVNSSDDSVASGQGCVDHIGEQLVPINMTGCRYVAIRNYSSYSVNFERVFVFPIHNNTTVWFNGVPQTISQGNFIDHLLTDTATLITSNLPVVVFQITATGCEQGGTMLPHLECTGSYSVSHLRPNISSMIVTLVTENQHIGNFTLNGNPNAITAADFHPLSADPSLSYCLKNISDLVPTGTVMTLTNSSGRFQLGILDGDNTGSCSYGFFSDYSRSAYIRFEMDSLFCEGSDIVFNYSAPNVDGLVFTGPNGVQLTTPPFVFPNANTAMSGWYYLNGIDTASCFSLLSDSIYIRVVPPSDDTTHLTATACDSYIWYGDTLMQSGEYTQHLSSMAGCDSVVTLHLTIIPLPELSHTQDTLIINGTSATLWASGADIMYWTDGNGSILSSGNSLTVSPESTSTYYVSGQNYAALGDNLVVNGDFEAGNEGFGSDYTYVTLQSEYHNYGRYYIIQDGHLVWGTSNLHGNGGTGLFMLVDGATTPNSVIWQQTVEVIPNTYYAFSAQIASTGYSNMHDSYAWLQFSINSNQLGEIFHSPDELDVWQPFYEVWYSGNNTSATLTLLNQNTNGLGNDFGVDDISFTPLTDCSVSDSILVAVMGYPDNVMDVDCVFPPDSNAFEMVELFQYPNVNSMSTPMVADMDGDGMPEIIACCYTYSAPYFSSGFHVVNGQTGELKYTISTVQYVNSGQMVTIADVDHDGMSELFLLGRDMKLYCYNYNGGVRWTSANTVDKNYLLSAADVNNDGNVEIVCGRYVYNAQTGVLLLEGNMVETGMGWGVPHGVSLPHHVPYYMYALGDVDNDGTLEVCAGNTVYKMNVNNMSGMTGNSWSVLRQANTPVDIVNKDGQTLLVDFDNDGDFDICVVGVTHTLNNYTSSHTVDVYVWDGQTSQMIAHSPLLVNGHFGASIPYSGDLNGDDFPEIIFAVPDVGMLAYTYDTTTLSMSLMHNHNPFAETSGFTVFDFNQDGRNEIVYRGTSQLFIVDGITLDNLCEPITAYSGTITEYPVVADVNADGHAEIIVTRAYNPWSSGNANGWVSVYGSQIPGAWSSARKVWNQWAYNSVNINEDMTVPQYQFDVSTTFPNGKKPFNSFLRQMPYIDSQGDLFNAVADIAVSEAGVVVQNDIVTLSLTYCNIGDNALFMPYNVAVFANTYGGDTICTVTIHESLPVDSCTQGEIQLPISVLCGFPNLDSLVVAVNCVGTGIAQNGGQQPECDTTNNTAAVAIQNFVPEVSHEDGFFCLSDTMGVLQGFPLGGTYGGAITSGDTLFFEAGVNLYQMTYTIADSNGCTATDTFQVTVAQNVFETADTVCSNTLPFLWNGLALEASGDYTVELPTTSGCDSVVTMHLTVINHSTTNIDTVVCGSCTWNGAVYTQTGVYTNRLQNINGCDSIVVLNLIVSPPVTAAITGPTVLCTDTAVTLTADSGYAYLWSTGDTTMSISVTEAGIYSLTVTNEYGCSAVVSQQLTSLGNPIMSVTVPEMCAGGSYTLSVGHQNTDNIHLGHGETTLSLSDTIYLPDGVYCDPFGCSYRSPLTFTAYADDATIQSVEDIYYVRLNIEHSYIGDLYINITCPSGQKADLLKYSGSGLSNCTSQIPSSSRGWASGNNMPEFTYLGVAYDYDVASCDASAFGNEPGIGWNYCWSNNTTQGYNYASGTGGYIYRSGNEHNNKVDSSNVAAGTQFYHPDDSFTSLIGCPLNGDWYIEVQDGWSQDNGYIFGWELSLSSEALSDTEFELDYSTAEGPWVTTLSDSLFQITPPEDLEHDTTIAYTFTVYDTSGCAYDTTVYIQIHAISHAVIDTAVCDAFTFGGITYTEAGQYTQTYTSAFGCDSIITLNLNILPPTDSTLVVTVVENALPYQLNGSTYTTSGTYPQQLTNAAGCDSLLTLELTVLYNVTNSVDTTVCASALPMTWYGHSYTAAGTHTNVLTALNGVDSTVTYTLMVDELAAVVGNVSHVVCYGESTGAAAATVTGGQAPLSYQWASASGASVSTMTTISGCAAGNYTFTVTDQIGCSVTVPVTINLLNDSLQPGTIASDQEVCSGNEIPSFTGTAASGGDNSVYQWQISTNNTDWSPASGNNTSQNYTYPDLSDESFWLRRAWVSQSCGTVYSNTVSLTVLPVTHDTVTANVCQENDYQGYGFDIPASEIEQPGEYVFERIQTTGPCDTFFVLLLTVRPTYSTDINAEICEGAGYYGHGFNIPSQATVDVETLSQTLTLQSVYGCDSTVNLELTVTDTALRIIPLTGDFCETMSAELMVETAMAYYVWSTGEQAPTITVTQPGIYSVTASQGGCEATAHIKVENCQYELYLPNAITPSKGDGLNDYFSIPEYNQLGMVQFEISIFNRWGEQVFYSTDKNFKWNGEYRGQVHQETIYNYIINYTDQIGKPHKVTGRITVL